MKILESYSAIAKSLLLEDEDDRYVHVGYGKYKEKDSRTGEALPNSPTYLKKDSGGYEMVDPDDPRLSKGGDKGGEEEPKGGGMGSSDFERDFDDSEPEDKPHGGDTGRDADSGGVEGPSPEDDDWNSETVMTAKLDGEEVGDIIGDEGHPKYKEALKYIMSFDPDDEKLYTGTGWKGHSGAKEETVTINGKQYRPIKESKQHILKENYERFFGDKKWNN